MKAPIPIRILRIKRHVALVFSCTVLCCLMAGCAQVTYKRGSSADDAIEDETVCRRQTTNETAYRDCLRDRGWLIASGRKTEEATELQPAANEEPLSSAAPSVAASYSVQGGTADPDPKKIEPKRATKSGKIKREKSDRSISSWWKFGASPDQLERDVAACIATLGPRHTPSPAMRTVTEELEKCLRESGWVGV